MTKEGVRRIKEINIKEEIDISENKNIEDSIEMCERSPHKLRIKYYWSLTINKEGVFIICQQINKGIAMLDFFHNYILWKVFNQTIIFFT